MARLGGLAVEVWHNGGLYRELFYNAVPGSADAAQSANRAIVQLLDDHDASEGGAVQVLYSMFGNAVQKSSNANQALYNLYHRSQQPALLHARLRTSCASHCSPYYTTYHRACE